MPHAKMESIAPGPTLIERAYEAILSAICDGRLQPGERLNQDELAARLQISRQPVGQALSVLKSQGFVRDNGRRGLIVAPLEREFFLAIYELREALDAMAARLAAERCSAADAVDGRRLVFQGRRSVQAGRVDDLISADMDLHMWIYRVAGNPLLAETMTLYWNHLRRAMSEILRQPSRREHIWDEHEGIVHAIIERDPKRAEKLALAHASEAADRIVESIPAAGLEKPTVKARDSLGRALAPSGRRKSTA
ncbi:MAG TPA: GntR family transcriptional regulator [Myxococcales bacterium]|jgi:DNA-binding GntR family transcriptional regulator